MRLLISFRHSLSSNAQMSHCDVAEFYMMLSLAGNGCPVGDDVVCVCQGDTAEQKNLEMRSHEAEMKGH